MKSQRVSKQSIGRRWLQRDVTLQALDQAGKALGFDPENPALLVHLSPPDPGTFTDPESFRIAYWRAEMWSKYPFENIGIDRKAAAMQTFLDCEMRCAETNARLVEVFSRPIPERFRKELLFARALLATLFHGFTMDEVVQHASWGPGASTSMPRSQATPQNKWVLGSHMTFPVFPYYDAFCNWAGRTFHEPRFVAGNKVVTVPKNAKTDRTIAIEPDWNMFFQLGLGKAIRRRAQRTFGLLWPRAQSINRELARQGSLYGGYLASMDLKGASDSVSLALVEALLPPDILKVVLDLRSPVGTLENGATISYEKVSSMGNGFTFELETVLFYCLVRAASGHAVVYGDDIIVHNSAFTHTSDLLEFCGFEVNAKKSYYTGPFRESCGGHFFAGVDVTPPYVRGPVKGLQRLALANRISELSDNGYWRDGLLYDVWKVLSSDVPKFLMGPRGVDGVLHTDLYGKAAKWSSRYQCFTGTRVVSSYVEALAPPEGGVLQALWTGYSTLNVRETIRFGGGSEYMKPPGQPRLHFSTWYRHWEGYSPWSCLTP